MFLEKYCNTRTSTKVNELATEPPVQEKIFMERVAIKDLGAFVTGNSAAFRYHLSPKADALRD